MLLVSRQFRYSPIRYFYFFAQCYPRSCLLFQHSWLHFALGLGTLPTDVLFLVDGSGSVKPDNFDKLRVLLKNIIDKMYIGPFGSRVALIQFSSRKLTKVEFNLDTYNNKEDMKKAIDDMVYQRKYTYTGYAMNLANKEVRKILRWLPTLSKTVRTADLCQKF